MEKHGYPFVFDKIDTRGADELMVHTLQYRFTSAKSGHSYIVRLERYVRHAYCLKFYDEENAGSCDKYSMRTNTFEPRIIFYTLIDIMFDVLKRDPEASFFFIGAEDEHDVPGKTTRRYSVYKRFAATYAGSNQFQHLRNDYLSLYILVNQEHVSDVKTYAETIEHYISDILFG